MSPRKNNWPDKRTSRRLEVALPLLVRGTDRHGVKFEDTAESYNISREGASFVTTRELERGQQISLIIPRRGPGGQRDFETTGKVLRVTAKNDKEWEIGVVFTGPRFRTYLPESA